VLSVLTRDGELGAGDVRPTHHPVVALVGRLAPLDPEQVAVTADADVVLIAAVQLLRALVPGHRDLGVVDLDLALEQRVLVGEDGLVGDVLHYSDRLRSDDTVNL